MLFSEPKIPQFPSSRMPTLTSSCFSALQRAENSSISRVSLRATVSRRFSALQRAENSSIRIGRRVPRRRRRFQCSSASRKFLNGGGNLIYWRECWSVSVLFSEPKIPQSHCSTGAVARSSRFSALQRAENSSILTTILSTGSKVKFQCSSASRKFLNGEGADATCTIGSCFSALQRAENSSIRRTLRAPVAEEYSFSALQRAENSSI